MSSPRRDTAYTPRNPGDPARARREARRALLSLLGYLWPRDDVGTRLRVVAAIVLLLVDKVATIWVPLVFAEAVDALTRHGDPLKVLTVPTGLILGYGVLRIVSGGAGELRDAVFARVKQRVVRVVSMQTFAHMHALSLRFHLDRQTGGLQRAINRGAVAIEAILRLGIFNIIPTLLQTVMVTAVIWHVFDWRYAAITLVAVTLYATFTIAFASWRSRIRRAMNDSDSEASTKAIDSLLNYETVKYFSNEAHEMRRYDAAQARYEAAAVKTQVTLNLLNLGQVTIIAIALALIMLLAARDVAAGHLTVGKFVLVNTYLMQLYVPLNFLGFIYATLRQSVVDLEGMFELLDESQEVTDRPDAAVLPAHLAAGVDAPELRFDDVVFGYQPERTILKGISFSVAPGHRTAVVGPTGAGKSTLSRLLFRFYDVESGSVSIDGLDVRCVTQASLRAAIGVVPQDTVLFNDTIRYNIAYGRIGASAEEVERAARLAQIHDFITALPDGYDTMVGERGLKLSGGEKQRVAIARTILKNPRVLILDEATSALDIHTEQEISTALRTVSAGRTTLVIAHRLATVVDADEIIVMQDGRIVERGNHRALLEAGGVYAAMWAAQADERAHREDLLF
ncbi:ATP-binding cassette subfamily B protein [Endobacter medicaginis]|uniref:ABC transporter ATP-binding protein/permease n=1 Tax=Endobacter medicaginis TaxID=1181271 RepID=A0A839V204_9PROT|nr:ABC transporter ATP-binding protein/permease [Endobacter medicaginis]MBB3174500.1 ATP-binding cassette subfamily B protein [Endobacter medicaginis]MCX5475051.1 ABC transporter ATP-binding protein/permease [Endobacter medicaginis]NVN30171.1 ABC transporter ATP-binding protein/permease [Endobacter medicaginis]